MSEPDYDPVRTEVLKELAEGRLKVYSFEAKSMAKELLERRAKDVKPPEPQQYDWAMFVP